MQTIIIDTVKWIIFTIPIIFTYENDASQYSLLCYFNVLYIAKMLPFLKLK